MRFGAYKIGLVAATFACVLNTAAAARHVWIGGSPSPLIRAASCLFDTTAGTARVKSEVEKMNLYLRRCCRGHDGAMSRFAALRRC